MMTIWHRTYGHHVCYLVGEIVSNILKKALDISHMTIMDVSLRDCFLYHEEGPQLKI